MTHPAPSKAQLLHDLTTTRQAVLTALDGLSDAAYDTPLNASGETVRAVLAHLIVWDWAKVDLLAQRAHGGTPAIGAMDADADATNAQATATWAARPLPALHAALTQARTDLLAALAALPETELARPAGTPYEAHVTLYEALAGTVVHNAEHAEELHAWRAP